MVTLTGRIEYRMTAFVNNGCWMLIGEDGNYYMALTETYIGGYIQLGFINSTTGVATEAPVITKDRADVRTDFNNLGLAGTTGTYNTEQLMYIQGTQYIIAIVSGASAGNITHVGGVRYRIVDSSTLSVDGGFLLDGTGWNFVSAGVVGFGHACGMINGKFYAIMTGTNGSITVRLVDIPFTGSFSDLSSGSWTNRSTQLPWAQEFFAAGGSTRRYYNPGSLYDLGNGDVGVFVYMGAAEITGGQAAFCGLGSVPSTPFMVYLRVTPGVGYGTITNVSSLFGIPFSDTEQNLAGDPGNERDDYTTPQIVGTEAIMGRVYSDAKTAGRFRFFEITNPTTSITASGDTIATFQLGGGWIVGTNERVMSYRIGDDIYFTLMDFIYAYTGTYASPTPPEPPPTPSEQANFLYYIERMDNRLWGVVEDAWCVDSGLRYPMPTPNAQLTAESATGGKNIGLYTIISGGSGYTTPIGQVIDLTEAGTGATVVFGVDSNGSINVALPVTEGSGYIQPQLTILDTTGTGAVIQPIVTNYVTFSSSTNVFDSGMVGDIIRMGGGIAEVVEFVTSASVIANIIVPITDVTPDDPYNTPQPAESGDWSITTPTMTVSGLEHLQGMSVVALADGGVVTGLTVSETGTVTLPVEATQIVVGLPFVAQLQTMYMDLGGGPTVQGRRKNIGQVIVRVEDSRPPEIGSNQPDAAAQPNQAEIEWGASPYTALTEIKYRAPTMPAGQPLPLFSGDYEPTNVFTTWDQKAQIAIQQPDPLPLTVTAVVPWLQLGDSPGQ